MYQTILSGLRTDILDAGYHEFDEHWELRELRKYPFTRLYCFAKGMVEITQDGVPFRLQPGCMHLVPSSAEVAWTNRGGFGVYWCLFHATVLEGIDLLSVVDLPRQVEVENPELTLTCFQRLAALAVADSTRNRLETESLLKVLIASFVDALEDGKTLAKEQDILRLRPVVTYIQQHLAGEVAIPDLAAIVSLEPKHFSKLFKKTLGIPPYAFVVQQRVKRVQRLLMETNHTLEYLAKETGFTDAFHLSKTFHRVTGITPSGFRARRYDVMS